MTAPPVRRQGWRSVSVRRLALLAGLWLGSTSPVDAEPGPPDPASRPPAAENAHAPPARLPDRPPATPLPPDEPHPDPPPAGRPPRPEPPRETSAAHSADPLLTDEEFAIRRRLNHVLYRDQRYRLLLDQARDLLSRGETLSAAEALSQILSADQDVFLWDGASSTPVSARDAGRRVLESLGESQRQVVERYLAATAAAALDAALASGRVQALSQVDERFPGTPAARQAERLYARQLFDAGRYRESAAAWRSLLNAVPAGSLTPEDRLQAALAAARAGDDEAASLVAPVAGAAVTLGGTTRTAGEWFTHAIQKLPAATASATAAAPHWTTPSGSLTGGRPRSISPPYRVPLWSTAGPLTVAVDPLDQPLLPMSPPWEASLSAAPPAARAWIDARLADGDSILTAAVPVVVDGQVVVRELDQLVSRDLLSGQVRWTHRCRTSLSGASAEPGDSSSPPGPFNQACAENSLLAALTSDGRCVFYVDEIEVRPSPAVSPGASPDAPSPDAHVQVLSNSLVAVRWPERVGVGRPVGQRTPSTADRPTATGVPGESTPAWTVGGPADLTTGGLPLAGHFFLGPPLPVGGRLLVLSERQGEVHLVVLDAATGAVELVQGLALVDRPVSQDRERMRLAFLPAWVDGLVLCPTPCGALVAFDLDRRVLRWVAQYRALDVYTSSGWRGDGRGAGTRLPVQPVVGDDVVLLLPPDSADLFAWRLTDGEFLWKSPRRGAHQLALTESDSVLAVSSDRIACLQLATGDRLWERSTPPICGQAIVAAGRLMAPLANGSLLFLDTARGGSLAGGPDILDVASGAPRRCRPLVTVAPAANSPAAGAGVAARAFGNLAASGDWIVSVSPLETAAYIGAETLRQVLEEGPAGDEAAANTRDPRLPLVQSIVSAWTIDERCFRAAEVALSLGDATSALTHLQALVARASPPAEGLPPDLQPRAEQLLRELLHDRLARTALTDGPTLAAELSQLAELARTPLDAARWQLARLRTAADRRDVATFLDAARRISELPPELLAPGDVSGLHEMAPRVMIRSQWERLTRALPDAELPRLDALVRAEWTAVQTRDDPAEIARFLLSFDGRSEADAARLLLAQRDLQAERLFAAESRLLSMLSYASCRSRLLGNVEAAELLAETWDRRGLTRDAFWARTVLAQSGAAAGRPRELRRLPWAADDRGVMQVAYLPDAPAPAEPRVDRTSSPLTIHIRVESLAGADEADAARPVPDSGEAAAMSAQRLAPLVEHRRELLREPNSSLRVINIGEPRLPRSTADVPPNLDPASQVELVLIDRETARSLAAVIVPARCREPVPSLQPAVGHFLPLADSAVHGISLLEGARLWTAERSPDPAAPVARREERLRLGPSGPDYCLVQTPEGLCCLDPVTGAVRWQRLDVPPDAGLYADEETGLCGDGDVLVVLEPDQRTCRVLATATGELLHTRQIPVDPRDARRPRGAFGSRLFFVTDTRGEPRFRLWDAAHDRLLLDAPAHPRLCHDRVSRSCVACLTADHQVLVVDVRSGRPLLRHPVPIELHGLVTGIRAWRDADCWYVYLAHGLRSTGSPRTENAATEVQLPRVEVNGTVAAYDARTRAPLWARTFENRTLLNDPDSELPYLVAICRVRDGLGVSTAGLRFEAISKQTGETVAEYSHVDPTRPRLVHAGVDRGSRELCLYGEHHRVVFRSVTTAAPDPLLMTAEAQSATADK